MLQYVALGSAIGGVSRYLLGGLVQRMLDTTFPDRLAGTYVDAHRAQMHGLTGERVLMRIHIGERDKHHGKPLYEAIVHLLRERHFAGATVLRGIMGFGASAGIHTEKILRLSLDLPLVVECVDTEEKIQAILPEADQMIGGGLITLERARVIMYRPEKGDK
jgi:PII-like signaling protein